MRKIFSAFGMLLAMMWLPNSMAAENSDLYNQAQNPQENTSKVLSYAEYQQSGVNTPLSDVSLKAEYSAKPWMKHLTKSVKAITSAADMQGEYVMTYKTLTSSGFDGGKAVKIVPMEGQQDSIWINDFWSTGVKVKAKVNVATKTVSIPNQKLGTHETYGDYDLAVITSAGLPDRNSEIIGKIGDDGSLTIDTWWAVFVTSSTKGEFFGAFYSTELVKPNATMSEKQWNGTTQTYNTVSFGVYVEQLADNVISVRNFANFGRTLEISLARDKSAIIASQVAHANSTGEWVTIAPTYKDDLSGLTAYSKNIICNTATDNRTISWGNWTLLTTGYYLGVMTEGKIVTNFDIKYPEFSSTEFEGEGTEANPYLIKKLDDLVLLADNVNNNTEYNYGTVTKYARVYMNKYFRLENDIDMSSYRFSPIGADWNHQFAGVFDGNNHTIKNLKVNTGEAGYAGLFGKCDTISVIKNLKFENPVVETSGYYAAAVAAWSLGTIENCHVTNATITNTGKTGAAAITAIGNIVKNSTVEKATIIGVGGYAAGIAGQLNTLITNSYAINVSIRAGGLSDQSPAGGVVGSLYMGKAENCYFSGTVDGTLRSNLTIGGVAGVCYKGEVNKCFSAGSVYGYNSGALVGGVVGALFGDLSNCYSNGRVISVSSKFCGGIVGKLDAYTDSNNKTLQSSVKNCYSANYVDAETYQYKKETERREVFGTIVEGTTPVIENVYFDNQIVNFKSTEYGISTAEMTSASGLKGFDSSVWTFADGVYPRLKGLDTNEAAYLSASAIIMHENSSSDKLARDAKINKLGNTVVCYIVNGKAAQEGRYSSIVGNELKIKEEFGTDTILFVNNNVGSRYLELKVSPIPFDGNGTEENPYLLKTKSDILTLAKTTTVIKQYFPDTYFKLTNDIDMEYDESFTSICGDHSDAHNQFAGHIDGDGHYIHKLAIGGVITWTKEPTETEMGTPTSGKCNAYKGFIGRLAPEGSVKNLNIAADCRLTGLWATSGAIVGYNYGLIENCKNYADVSGYSCWIGGIVGQNNASGVIRNCYNEGSVISGYMDAGGITGANYGLIENCQNAGDIAVDIISNFQTTTTKLGMAGGITGAFTGGRLLNCVNSGTVFAYNRVGGLTGSLDAATTVTYPYHNDIINSINYGTVLCPKNDREGAVAGTNGSTGVISNSYYDSQITILKAAGGALVEGLNGVETSELTSGKALKDFSTEIWDFAAGKYPVLKQFVSENRAEITRTIIAKVATGEDMAKLSSDVDLSDNCTWTLKQGKIFKVEGNKLVVPATIEEVAQDTLVATAGKITKPFIIRVIPAVPLSGKGTATDPYLIKTPTDWVNFANFIASTENNMSDVVVKLDDDLDFTNNADYKPLSLDNRTIFNGELNGAGHTISGLSLGASGSYVGAMAITLGEQAYVHDLTVSGKISSTGTYVGGVVGTLKGKLENVTSKMTVTSTKNYAAGMVASVESTAELIGCVNEGEVTSAGQYTAGLVASSKDGAKYANCGNKGKITYTGTSATSYLAGLIAQCYPATLIGCYNMGEIVVTQPAKAGAVSGLVGFANASSKDANPFEFKDCYNTANISSLCHNAGLVVAVNTSGYTRLNMDGCYNTGDISSTSTVAKSSNYTAGLSTFYTHGSTYRNCWNSGTIMSEKPVYAAGLFAYYKGTFNEANRTYFTNCYNTGDIIASGNQGGGIVAYASNYLTIDSCYNMGDIEGGFGLGGIVACLSGTATVVSNCWNSGDITTSTNRAGGIIGYNASASTVKNCANFGDVSTTGKAANTCYGIGGIAGQGSSHFFDIYSTGNVKGAARVGGLLGYGSKNNTQITNGYFSGTVEAPADTCGMIIGMNMLNNGKNWTEQNFVKNVYYLKDAKVECVDTAGIAVSVEELTKVDLGENWISFGDHCYPALKDNNDNDNARLEAAAIVFAEGDNFNKVTKNFHIGIPAGVTWSTNVSSVAVNGNTIEFKEPYTGNLELTATCGSITLSYDIKCEVSVISGVDSNDIDGKVVVKEEFYNAAGVKVAKPEGTAKAVYLVVRTYDDGTQSIVKELR